MVLTSQSQLEQIVYQTVVHPPSSRLLTLPNIRLSVLMICRVSIAVVGYRAVDGALSDRKDRGVGRVGEVGV